LTGAAVATAAASYASAALIGGSLVQELKPKWRRPLRLSELMPFLTCSSALLAGTTLNAVTYTASSRVVAAAGNVVSAAAHQICLQCWWLFSFVSVPLSLAAQSLLPSRSAAEPASAERTAGSVVCLGLICAGLMSTGNFAIPFAFPSIFTADPSVVQALGSVVGLTLASQFAISLATALDGVFIGCGWLSHYVGACTLGTLSSWFGFRHGMRTGAGLSAAWQGLMLFSGVRVAAHLLGYRHLRRSLKRAEWAKVAKAKEMGLSTAEAVLTDTP